MSVSKGELHYVDFTTSNPTTGVAQDADSAPTVEVFDDNNMTPVETPVPVKRTGRAGNYVVSINTALVGYSAGNTYNVVVTATVSGKTGRARVAIFVIRQRNMDDVAYPAISGRQLDVDASGQVPSSNMRGTDNAALATVCTEPRLAELDPANMPADLDTLLARLTAARAAFLDFLNIGGLVASKADLDATTVASRVRVIVPPAMERPDSGSTPFRIWIYTYSEQQLPEDLDFNPTVTAENNSGVDRSANLGTVVKPGGSTGVYYVDYTVAVTHELEGLIFKVTATKDGQSAVFAASSYVVETTSFAFTEADRAKLNELNDVKITTARANNLDKLGVSGTLAHSDDAGTYKADVTNLDAAVSSRSAPGDAMTLTTPERDAIAIALLDLANGVESGFTVRQTLRLFASVLLSKVSGGGTSTEVFRDINDSKNRVTAAVDANGNRTAITLDAT